VTRRVGLDHPAPRLKASTEAALIVALMLLVVALTIWSGAS
jgi:hypothetical protein